MHVDTTVSEVDGRDLAHPDIAGIDEFNQIPAVIFVLGTLEFGVAAQILNAGAVHALIRRTNDHAAPAIFLLNRVADGRVHGDLFSGDAGNDAVESQIL